MILYLAHILLIINYNSTPNINFSRSNQSLAKNCQEILVSKMIIDISSYFQPFDLFSLDFDFVLFNNCLDFILFNEYVFIFSSPATKHLKLWLTKDCHYNWGHLCINFSLYIYIYICCCKNPFLVIVGSY